MNSSNSNSGTAVSASNRLNDLLMSFTFLTRVLLFVNVAIHIIIFLFSFSIGNFAISAYSVLYGYEYYRVVSSAFVHVGLLHIGMNMSSLLQLGPDLEKMFGTIQFLFFTVWSVFLIGIIYIFLSWCLYMALNDGSQLRNSGVGFSGVLFAYAVVEAFHTRETVRSVFGMFNVPAKLFPFILLVLLSVLIPGISFLGHLSGCIVGILSVAGMNVFLPSKGFIKAIESSPLMSCFLSRTGYVTFTNYSFVHPTFSFAEYCNCPVISSSFNYLCKLCYNLLETAYYALQCHTLINYVKSFFNGISSSNAETNNQHEFSSSSENDGSVLNPMLGGRQQSGLYQPVKLSETSTHSAANGAGRVTIDV